MRGTWGWQAKAPAILAFVAVALAQDQRTPAANVSVSGTVKDSVTGKPLAGYNVSTFVHGTWLDNMIIQSRSTTEAKSVTDERGHYRLGDLPPDSYRIEARSGDFGTALTRHITVAGHDLEGIDFSVKVNGTISGKVLDENKEPVPQITVWLISREYYNGQLGYFFKSSGQSNDRGEYTIGRVEAEHPYLVLAEKRDRQLPTHSEVPLDPKLRRRAPMRTFYPNSTDRDGAVLVNIRPGERRQGIDIELKKSQNYCAEGIISGAMGPAAVYFGITAMQPSDGQSSSGGMMTGIPGGMSGPDGKFRICNLTPGTYRLVSWERGRGQGLDAGMADHALVPIAITDQDLANLRVNLAPGPAVKGEAVLDGPMPVDGVPAKTGVSMEPLLRSNLPGERFNARVEIPGTFSFAGLVLGDYGVHAWINLPGYYIKDVTSSGASVMYEPVPVGGAIGESNVRVIVGGDGATLNATVTDKDGNPASDMQVLVLPKAIRSEAMLQAAMVTGVTDQRGTYHSHTLAPGGYYVVATNEIFDATPESVGRLWRARNHFQEIELTPKGSAQATLQPVKIE